MHNRHDQRCGAVAHGADVGRRAVPGLILMNPPPHGQAFFYQRPKLFRDAETKRRMKDQAAHAGHMLCRARVVEEKQRGKGTSTTEHLKLVLSVIDGSAKFPLKDE